MANPELLIDGLTLPEGLRWHHDRLYFSDLLAFRVMSVTLDGRSEHLADVPHKPSGLGFTPDGRLLIVSMRDSRLLRLDPTGLVEAADLSSTVMAYCNDMVVDRKGRAYVGDVGYDRHAGETERQGALIRVDPSGAASIAAGGIDFPNGAVITPDGRRLILAETFGHRLSAFDIDEEGNLHNRRTFAQFDGKPDGMSLDAEGAVWVADHTGHRFVRVLEGGEITHTITTGDRHTFTCALGGEDGHTLFFSTGLGDSHAVLQANKSGRIDRIRVDVPAA